MAFNQGTPGVGWMSIVQVGVATPTPIPVTDAEFLGKSKK